MITFQRRHGSRSLLIIPLCDVENAETTLNDYKDFLKNEKYKEWNDQQ